VGLIKHIQYAISTPMGILFPTGGSRLGVWGLHGKRIAGVWDRAPSGVHLQSLWSGVKRPEAAFGQPGELANLS